MRSVLFHLPFLGDVLAGCDFGPVDPTQLCGSLAGIVLLISVRTVRRRHPVAGQTFVAFVLG